jgi:hypothetical protein
MSRTFIDATTFLGPRVAASWAFPLTISCWIRPTAAGLWTVAALTSPGNVQPWFRIANSDVSGAEAQQYDGTANGFAFATPAPGPNAWSHIAGCFVSNAGRRAYANGHRSADDATAVTAVTGPSLYVSAVSGLAPFVGDLAELAIYNTILSDADIAKLAAGQNPTSVSPSSLIAYYPMYGDNAPEPDLMGGAGLPVVNALKGTTHPSISGVVNPQSIGITRTPIVDDDGTGTTGTIIDNAWKQELYNQIDAVVAANVGGGTGGYAPIDSPHFTGIPTAPTPGTGTNTTQLATAAFVESELATGLSSKAPLASPAFTGVPTAPTAAASTNTTQVATTAFVESEITNKTSGVYAPLASPALTGTPTAPTAAANTNTTQVATTAFVQGAVAQSPQTVTLTDGATVSLDVTAKAAVYRLAAAGDRTLNITGTPFAGQKVIIQHFASGGAGRTLTLGTMFRFGTDITALTQTASGKTDYIGAIYNSTDSKWDVVAVTKGF